MNDSRIERIMGDFDFAKVKVVMLTLDWEWFHIVGPPTIQDLKAEARRLLTELVNKPDCVRLASGGFRAELIDGHLSLCFIVTDSEAA